MKGVEEGKGSAYTRGWSRVRDGKGVWRNIKGTETVR